MQVVAGNRHRRRTGLDRHRLDPANVRRDRPTGLGLPPVVDHGNAEVARDPLVGIGVETLAGEEERMQARGVVAGQQLGLWVFLLHGSDGRRGGEYRPHPVIGDHSPEGARVGGADGFSFVQNRRRTTDQRRVHDVGVADDPADIRCRPPHVARIHPVDVSERPGHRHGVTAVVAHDALGLSRRAGGVQDVERIGRRHRDGIDRRR